jgi:hypothetical protein
MDIRRCHDVLNSLHSAAYFTPHYEKALADHGVEDPMAAYLVRRAAPAGPVGPGAVAGMLYSFAYPMIARHLPGTWSVVTPEAVLAARLRAADQTLRSALDDRRLGSPDLAEAARLALAAARAGSRPGRPLYAAHADLPAPDEPHLALWHAATLLREHRGDSHLTALATAGLDGIEALVSHSATPDGMPREMVMSKRGWSAADWDGAVHRLRDRGLMEAGGALTPAGVRLRRDVEAETDRLDAAPYRQLGERDVARLTELAAPVTATLVEAGVFPPPLRHVFDKR